MSSTSTSATPIRTLICKRDLEMGQICLNSLIQASQQPLQLIIHEDGSLSPQDCDWLLEKLPSATLVRRAERNAEVEEVLKERPECRAYRQRHPLSNKLLDIPIIASIDEKESATPVMHYVDTDILFFKKVKELFPPGHGPMYLQEDEQGYSGPLLDLIHKSKRWVPSGANTGLFRLPWEVYDLDYAEWFLSQPQFWEPYPSLTEQTCFALLMGNKALTVSADQIFCSVDKICLHERTIAVHFMAFLKKDFASHVEPSQAALAASTPTALNFLPAKQLTTGKVVVRKLQRTLKRK